MSKVDYMKTLSTEDKTFSRSDIILESKEWSNSIIAKVNGEFDCDSVNDDIRKHSETILSRELNFADHVIPYVFTLMRINGSKTTNLVRTIISKQIKGWSPSLIHSIYTVIFRILQANS